MPYRYHPHATRIVSAVVVAFAAVASVWLVADNGWHEVWHGWPWLVLLAGSSWVLLWRPHVVVDEAMITIVNPFRTIRLPWPSVDSVETRYALTLHTRYGRFAVWAVPAPGAAGTVRLEMQRSKLSRELGPASVGTRVSDLPGTPSGDVAEVIRTTWERHHRAGHLDDPRLDPAHRAVTWTWPLVAALLAVSALCAIGLVT